MTDHGQRIRSPMPFAGLTNPIQLSKNNAMPRRSLWQSPGGASWPRLPAAATVPCPHLSVKKNMHKNNAFIYKALPGQH
jgi:hypothetical protein